MKQCILAPCSAVQSGFLDSMLVLCVAKGKTMKGGLYSSQPTRPCRQAGKKFLRLCTDSNRYHIAGKILAQNQVS